MYQNAFLRQLERFNFLHLGFFMIPFWVGCTTISPNNGDLFHLQGTWESGSEWETITITIDGDSLRFYRDTDFWFDTTITLIDDTHPPHFRALIEDCPPSQKESKGKVVPAIYKIEGETLVIGAFVDNEAPPPKAFDGPGVTRYDLKKVD